MTWNENPDLTEPAEGDYDRPLMGVTGGQRARAGDSYTLAFDGDGDEVDTDQGTRAAFDVTLVETDFDPVTGDGDPIEEGDEVRLMTGSARFLSQLADHMPLDGKELMVTIDGVGYGAEYSIIEV